MSTIVIGADTLTKFGGSKEHADYILNSSKIIRVGDTYIGSVGHASWPLVLASCFQDWEQPPAFHSVEAIFETAQSLHQQLKERYFLNAHRDNEDSFEDSRLYCLLANARGIFGLYSLRSVQQYSRFYAFGSGSDYAMGAMHVLYGTSATAYEVARAALTAAAAFDGSTGDPFDLFELDALLE